MAVQQTAYHPVRAWSIAGMLTMFILVNFADKIVLGLVAVPMMEDLKLSPSQFGLIGSSFFWLFALSGIVGGFLADRLSSKWMLFVMALSWSAFQLPIALSSSLAVIIGARVMLGAGEGPAWPVAIHCAYKWFPDSKRNLPVAFFSQGGAIGLLIAGMTVPLITAHYGWRMSFYVLAAVGVAWALVWMLVGDEGRLDAKDPAAAARAKFSDSPLARVLKDPTVYGNFLLHFVGYWGLSASLTWLPAYFQKGLGYDNVAAGRLYGIVVAVSIPLVIAISMGSQRMLNKGWTSRDARARFASVTLIVAGVLMAMMLLDAPSKAMRIGLFAVAFGLTTAIYSLGPAMLAQVTPTSRRGAVLAIDNSIASLAGVLAPAVSGALIQATPGAIGFEHGFALTGLLMVVGGIVGFFIVDPEKSATRLLRPTPAY